MFIRVFTIACSVILLLLFAGPAPASSLEVARLAQQLQQISQELAGGSASRSWSGSVKHNAKLLGQKAQRLQDSVQRGRSSAYIRLRFTDVSRYYQRLEDSVVRSMDRDGTGPLRNDFLQLAESYEALRYEFYGDTYYQSLRGSPPAFPFVLVPPQALPGGQNYPGAEAGVLIVPRASDYSGRRTGQPRVPVTAREYRRGDTTRHRSPVLERQRRNERLRDLSGAAGRGARVEANQGYYRLRP